MCSVLQGPRPGERWLAAVSWLNLDNAVNTKENKK